MRSEILTLLNTESRVFTSWSASLTHETAQHDCSNATHDITAGVCRGYSTQAEKEAAQDTKGVRLISLNEFQELLKWGIMMGVRLLHVLAVLRYFVPLSTMVGLVLLLSLVHTSISAVVTVDTTWDA